jgi:ADP-heptose:LPS heptosyltransferase
MRILFVTSNRIGDAVLSTGLVAHLLATRPGARLTIACGPVAAPLFQAMPGLDRIHVLAKRPLAGHWLALWRAAVAVRWDLVVDLRASALAWTLWAAERRVFEPSHAPVHRVRQLARLFGLEENPPAPRIWLAAGHHAAAAGLIPPGPPVLAVGPTANWAGKEWPADRFVELIRRLTAPAGPLPGARVAALGGPGERSGAAPVLDALPPDRRIDLVGTVDLLVAAACLARARIYVGNDSGLMHLAAASGIPTLGLFGPSREQLYAPWGPNAATVRGPRGYDAIVGAPGYDHRLPVSHMTDLAVEPVEAAVHALLARTAEAAPAAREAWS